LLWLHHYYDHHDYHYHHHHHHHHHYYHHQHNITECDGLCPGLKVCSLTLFGG
jgi:hypothetical protein